ncbi:unnamed protein product [Pleuronectes platessa]|uniref:Uncharacterized protein n=1 Tax=Pleuronectes platessa TaxID=8262 RepID=A0A9N7YVV8_PLEPL|nr:unnamed protein product [Pleuronectes platessa]
MHHAGWIWWNQDKVLRTEDEADDGEGGRAPSHPSAPQKGNFIEQGPTEREMEEEEAKEGRLRMSHLLGLVAHTPRAGAGGAGRVGGLFRLYRGNTEAGLVKESPTLITMSMYLLRTEQQNTLLPLFAHSLFPPVSTRWPCADRNATGARHSTVLSRPLPKLQQPPSMPHAKPPPNQPTPRLPIPISPCILNGGESSCLHPEPC